MKQGAILYTSNTGYTAQYAELLGQKTGLPVYSLKEAVQNNLTCDGVIYLGWLMAGVVKGYRTAAKRFPVKAVCGVGMGATGSQLDEIRTGNRIAPETPVFTLQGGFDLSKLHGIYRFMMKVMAKTAGKGLAAKQDRTPDEDAMLELLTNGGNYVTEENLTAVLDWYGKNF